MKDKITAYVRYVFNLNNINDDDMFLEVTSNLYDRYDDYIKEGLDEDSAYLKTIDSLGDFNFKDTAIDEAFNYKPNWANISLWISLALAILGTIVLLLNATISMLFTGISISLYIGASYYLYHLSQYALKTEKDINKHNELLKGIFKNLKTNFVFWNINISYWLANIVIQILLTLAINPITDPDDLYLLIFLGSLIFIVVFIILFIIFKNIYNRLEQKYFELTQTKKLDSYAKDVPLFVITPKTKQTIIKIIKIIILTLFTLTIILTGTDSIYRGDFVSFEFNLSIGYLLANDVTIGTIILFIVVLGIYVFNLVTNLSTNKNLTLISHLLLVIIHIVSLIAIPMIAHSNTVEGLRYGIIGLNALNIIVLISSIILFTIRLVAAKKNVSFI